MSRKRALWLAVMLGLLVLSTGVILAQKSNHRVIRAKTVELNGGSAWMGVHLTDVTADKAKELKLPGESGAVVTEVELESPAAKAGLQENDVILEFAGERVRSVAELRRLVRETPPGRTVSLKVSRAGEVRNMSVKLEAHMNIFSTYVQPPEVNIPEVHVMPPFQFNFGGLMGRPLLGIEANDLTSQLASYFGVRQGKGVLVQEVKAGSAAEKAGLRAGDCIVQVDGKEIGSVDELREALRDGSEEKQNHTLTIVRDRREQTVKVEIKRPSRLVRPEAADDLDSLDDEIAELRDYGPKARLDAENLRREIEAQSRAWQAEMESHKAELQGLLKRETRDQLRAQAAQMRDQAQALRKQLEDQRQQLKKETLDQQRQLQKELRDLREQLRQATAI